VLNLVAAVISLGVLALVLYVGYRFFVSRNADTNNR
jgi:Tfp pilus assembly protein PilE